MTRSQDVAVMGLGGILMIVACGGTVDLRWDEGDGVIPDAGATGGTAASKPPKITTQPLGGARNISGPAVQPATAGQSVGGAPAEPNVGGAPVQEPSVGGAPDDISFGGAPTYLDECATDLTHVLPRPEFECPAEIGNGLSSCDIPENAGCVWQVEDPSGQRGGYVAASCYATLTGMRWSTYGNTSVGPAGINSGNCPHWLPDASSSCSGHAGEICHYPAMSCSCASDDATWSCDPDPGTEGNPPWQGWAAEVQRLCPPEGLDESKQIKDLTEAEVLTWCSWHGDPSGNPRPEVIDDRDTDGYATYGFGYEWDLCMPDIPTELCVRNFRAVSDCTATLGDLDDCIETFYGNHQNDRPAWVGHGCVPLVANSSCKGLMVSEDCVLPLE